MKQELSINDFSLDNFQEPGKTHLNLRYDNDPNQGILPVNLIVGNESGPTFLIFAGVHGDEYEGVQTVIKLYRNLLPEMIKGKVVMVPVANVSSYHHTSRMSGVDGKNLAREFPGDKLGTYTQRLAWCLTHSLIANANFLLDLHSGGTHYAMPAMTGYWDRPDIATGRQSIEAAHCFGTDVVWAHREVSPGRSVSAASELNIPWLYTEAHGGRRIKKEQQQLFYEGSLRLMHYLGMLDVLNTRQPPSASPVRLTVEGDGNLDFSVKAEQNGFFIPEVSLLDEVRKGQLIGKIYDWHGRVLQDVMSESDSVVMMLSGTPYIKEGQMLYSVAMRRKA